MTITTIRPVRGELPPGTVDGYCTTCAGDTIVSAPDYACPACGVPVHPDSLPRDARLAMMRGQAAEPAPEPIRVPVEPVRAIAARAEPPAVKTVTLRGSRHARAWSKATDDLLAAAENEERAAEAAYKAAKSNYEAARRETHRIREIRTLVQVEGATASPPTLSATVAAGNRWAKAYEACRICGLTTTKHAADGRCRTCDSYWRHRGSERPTTTTEAQTNGS